MFVNMLVASEYHRKWGRCGGSENWVSRFRCGGELAGTSVELGQQILQESGLALIPASDMADGAQKIVAAISEMN